MPTLAAWLSETVTRLYEISFWRIYGTPRLTVYYFFLHGAMVADGYPDPEADLLARVRDSIGHKIPVVGVLDLHGNISMDMLSAADVLLGYTEYPHTDSGARGVEATEILASLMAGDLRPSTALVSIPALLVSMNMRTDRGPMAEVFSLARELENRPGVIDVSLFGGFPYADIPNAGASVICTTKGDASLARRCATEAAEAMWKRRHGFDVRVATAEEAVTRAMDSPRGPIVLADIADNPASGGAGDHPHLLQTALQLGLRNAVASLFFDPETVHRAIEVGTGGIATFHLGGKIGAGLQPIVVRARVNVLSDGRFTCTRPHELWS